MLHIPTRTDNVCLSCRRYCHHLSTCSIVQPVQYLTTPACFIKLPTISTNLSSNHGHCTSLALFSHEGTSFHPSDPARYCCSGPGALRKALRDLPQFDLQQLSAYNTCSIQQQQQLHQQQPLSTGWSYAGRLQQSSVNSSSAVPHDAELWRAYMVLSFLSHVRFHAASFYNRWFPILSSHLHAGSLFYGLLQHPNRVKIFHHL